MKRMLVAVTVAETLTDHDVALAVDAALGPATDATAWEWGSFWLDFGEGVVGMPGDGTQAHPSWYSCDLCDRWRNPVDLVSRDGERICREHVQTSAK